ncbi:MAG: hypothetical protein DI551_05595 [Micavibrio aeruginosavorus]|uniref:Uncharacterized protein n=1 Tax=Micavibrio aeruginosavorus TaxID=349221 RepID=A0A2W5MY48_9BACT|nr:MAG: hypothetical protein DI551_05595 [Micavibrio aeruginosavorus]
MVNMAKQSAPSPLLLFSHRLVIHFFGLYEIMVGSTGIEPVTPTVSRKSYTASMAVITRILKSNAFKNDQKSKNQSGTKVQLNLGELPILKRVFRYLSELRKPKTRPCPCGGTQILIHGWGGDYWTCQDCDREDIAED